jgi:hypothetical protein
MMFGISRPPDEEPTSVVGAPEQDSDGVGLTGERERVVRFRLGQLVSAGYDYRLATRLAEDLAIDWHKAVALLKAGCDPRTAGAILL